MPQVLYLVELEHLFDPPLTRHEVLRGAEGVDVGTENVGVHVGHLTPGEDAPEEQRKERDVLGDELRYHVFTHGTDKHHALRPVEVLVAPHASAIRLRLDLDFVHLDALPARRLARLQPLPRLPRFALDVAGRHQHRLERAEAKVVVGLVAKLRVAEVEEEDDFPREGLCRLEPLGEKDDLRVEEGEEWRRVAKRRRKDTVCEYTWWFHALQHTHFSTRYNTRYNTPTTE